MRSLVLLLVGLQVGLAYIPLGDDEGGAALASAADWQQATGQNQRGLAYVLRTQTGSKLSGLAAKAKVAARHLGSEDWDRKFGPHPREEVSGLRVFQQHQLRSRGAERLRSEAKHLRDGPSAPSSWAEGAGMHIKNVWGVPMSTQQATEQATEEWLQRVPKGSKLAAARGGKKLAQGAVAKQPIAKAQIKQTAEKLRKAGAGQGDEAKNAWIVAALTREMEDDGVTPRSDGESTSSSSTPWNVDTQAAVGKPKKHKSKVDPVKVVQNVISPKKHPKLDEDPVEDDVPADPAPPVEDSEDEPEVEDEWEEVEEDADKIFDLDQFTWAEIPLHMWAWWIALLAVIITIVISISLIVAHLETYERPEVQKYVIRILFMTPLYAVIAFLSLTFTNAALFLNVVRDCYEAFVLYNFLKMLYVWLGGERAVINAMAKKKQIQLPFPLHTIEPWEMGDEMFYNCKFGVLQYVVVIPVCAIVTFITAAVGAYEGEHWYTMDFWIELLIISSATWAIYCLITFYLSMQEELEASVNNALGKFLCVKAVVFFCFWQGIVLHLVLAIGYMPQTQQYSAKNFVIAIEQWLICLEMLVIAIGFNLAYPVKEITEMRDLSPSPYGSMEQSDTTKAVA